MAKELELKAVKHIRKNCVLVLITLSLLVLCLLGAFSNFPIRECLLCMTLAAFGSGLNVAYYVLTQETLDENEKFQDTKRSCFKIVVGIFYYPLLIILISFFVYLALANISYEYVIFRRIIFFCLGLISRTTIQKVGLSN